MEVIKAIVLGCLQGFTEFLPVSSSGHLVIASELLSFQEQGLVFDVCLHVGTLVSVLIVFRKEVLHMAVAPFAFIRGTLDEQGRTYLAWDVYVIVATLPAVVVGLFLRDSVEQLFSSTFVTYCMLVITGITMLLASKIREGTQKLNTGRSILVGCAQACAILPGLSRSGFTIFMGMLLGVPRETIARFSFIMSIPAILGAAVLQVSGLADAQLAVDAWLWIGAGMAASVISGYLAIKLLLDIIRRNRLQWFGYYCLILASIGLGHHFLF